MAVRNIVESVGIGKSSLLRIINNKKEFATGSLKLKGNCRRKLKTTPQSDRCFSRNHLIYLCKWIGDLHRELVSTGVNIASFTVQFRLI